MPVHTNLIAKLQRGHWHRSQFVVPLGSMLHIIGFCTGCGALVMGVCHEIVWRKRFARSSRLPGVITKEVWHDDGGSSAPEIEYMLDGEPVRFVSKYYYGWRIGTVGKQVCVLLDKETGGAEELKWSNRWLGTVTPAIVGTFFVLMSLFG